MNIERIVIHPYSSPPCGEGLGVGIAREGAMVPHGITPHPDPPPQGGREKTPV